MRRTNVPQIAVLNERDLDIEHIYMKPEVNSNRFEISNGFEKSFRLHDDFAAATFQTEVRFYCTYAMILTPLLAIIKTSREPATTYMLELYEDKRNI